MIRLAAIAALALSLGGCAYDYVQHSDRVSYAAGNAVHANLEQQTANPSKGTMQSVTGLGQNGVVVVPAPTATN